MKDLLKTDRTFSLEEILKITDTVLKILDYLHSRKPAVFYGDLKSDNLMISAGTLYLVDFGSATFEYQQRSHKLECKGTRGFAAPEQYHGVIDCMSDFTVLVRHWSVCAEEGNGDTFCDARISESLSLNAVARKLESAGRMRQEANSFLDRYPSFEAKGSVLCSGAAAAASRSDAGGCGGQRGNVQKTLPELQKNLTVITQEYYGFAYQSGTIYVTRYCAG